MRSLHAWRRKGRAPVKLEAFNKRVGAERVGGFFTTDIDLRGLVIQALAEHNETASPEQERVWSPVPAAPQAYIAHPYTLLQSRRLVGPEQELSLLTDWVARPESEVYHINPATAGLSEEEKVNSPVS